MDKQGKESRPSSPKQDLQPLIDEHHATLDYIELQLAYIESLLSLYKKQQNYVGVLPVYNQFPMEKLEYHLGEIKKIAAEGHGKPVPPVFETPVGKPVDK